MKRSFLSMATFLCYFGCNQPFDFGHGVWVIRSTSPSQWDHYFRVEGDTMKIIQVGDFSYHDHAMGLTADSLTLPSPCDLRRVAYMEDGRVNRIDSTFEILPLVHLTSTQLFERTGLRIELPPADSASGHHRTDANLYVGRNNDPSLNFSQGFFSDGYLLRLNGTDMDSSDVTEWAEWWQQENVEPIRIALFIDTSFSNTRTAVFEKHLKDAFNGKAVFFEARFDPDLEYFIGLNRREGQLSKTE